jgi:hypothetical protein
VSRQFSLDNSTPPNSRQALRPCFLGGQACGYVPLRFLIDVVEKFFAHVGLDLVAFEQGSQAERESVEPMFGTHGVPPLLKRDALTPL